MLCCINFIHSAGIVHRDIKPANMLIDTTCKVTICDFGLARALPNYTEQDIDFQLEVEQRKQYALDDLPGKDCYRREMFQYIEANSKALNNKRRSMTCCVQSRWYRAPEVISTNRSYGKAIDIWSLGVVFAEMIHCSSVYAGKPDFAAENRFLFRGTSCYPLSPHPVASDIDKDDHMIKILEFYPHIDLNEAFSFLTNK